MPTLLPTLSPTPLARWACRAAFVLAGWGAGLAPAGAQVVISQVYGGGGNSGAPLNADYVELRNLGTNAVDLSGWSLQYSAAANSSWSNQLATLSGSIAPGAYFLIRIGTPSTTVGQPLPTPDATAPFALGATAGKVALVNNSTALVGTCPIPAAAVVDFVGYGTAANCSEGGANAPAPSNTLAILRAGSGSTDTNNNASDFATGTPAPRNSGSGGGGNALATTIPAIQGSGGTSPLLGQIVVAQGVITRITGNGFGFYMQDLTGDGNPATSDGIFVFVRNSNFAAPIAVGNLVAVTGTVVEFNTGAASNADTLAHTVTEIDTITAITLVGSGYTITPTVVNLPEAVNDDLERYEGMLVTLTGPFTIQQNFFQGRFGQLTLAVGGRIETPTNRYRPGAQAQALADENARRRIILDDGTSQQNPSPTPYLGADALPRAGDQVGSITGVIDYGLATASNTGFGDYRIVPTVMPTFSIANPRSAAPDAVGGNIKVASFNLLNYFTTFFNGQTVDGLSGQGCALGNSVAAGNCRGASNLAEFQRQRTKIVEAMAAIDADAFGLMELQNNGNVALQNLVDALNARLGAGTYATTALPPQGTGTDAIRVAAIYKPAKLTPTAVPISDPDPVNNRPTLAQTFTLGNGERFTLVVNHLKSKGSCPAAGDADFAGNNDSGDGQGCWNAQRLAQAQRLRSFVAQVQALSGSSDVLLIGDFNAYGMEDPIHDLTSNGYADQLARYAGGSIAYSYVFDGAAGRLDHAIANTTLSPKVTRAVHWHINADEIALADYNQEFKAPNTNCGGLCPPDPYSPTPYRSSDHDPIVVGLGIYKTLVAPPGSTTLVGSAGDDVLVSGSGRRTLTGGGGSDQFTFVAGFAGGATITDFTPGADQISLRAVLPALGIPATDPIGQGYVRCSASGADALIGIDPDAAGPAANRPMILVKNRSCAVVLVPANFIF